MINVYLSRFFTCLIGFFLVLNPLTALSQADIIEMNGLIKDERSNKLLAGVSVVQERDGVLFDSVKTGVNGRFTMQLQFEHDYNIRFIKDGFVSKFININANNIPDENKVGGFAFDLNVTLFEEIEGIDFDILKQPIGKARFEKESADLAFDFEYTKSIQARIAELRRQLQKKYKEEEEKLLADKKAAEAEAAKKAKFDALVQEGDGLMSNANYMNAVFKYSEALDLFPDSPSVITKLEKAKKALEDNEAEQEAIEKYNKLIADADKLFGSEKYAEAKTKYEEAKNVRPSETYPPQKIKEIDGILNDLAAKEALNKQYNDALAKADEAFKANKFEASIMAYKKALDLKPGEKYPAEQIRLAEQNIAELKAKEELETKYNEAISAADALFADKKYQEAIGSYNKALELKANETYPKDQIAKANTALEELAKAAAKDEQYSNLIKEADKLFSKEDWSAAKSKYNEALALKQETYPKDQIAKIDATLAEQKAKEEANRAYTDAIAKADGLMNAENYSDAIVAYNAALKIKATETYPKEQIAAAQAALKSIAEKEALDKSYNDALKKADDLFAGEKYQAAIEGYNQALAIKSKESYPKDQIAKAEAAIKTNQVEAAKRKSYDDAVAQADKSFEEKDFTAAIKSYQSALKIYPEEAYPKTKIGEANTALDSIAQAEANRKQYDALIKTADGQFKKDALDDALKTFTEAAAILPSESYPDEKIKEIQGILKQRANQEALNKQYADKIAEADKRFEAKNYDAAKNAYTEASGLKPMEQYPKDQMAKIAEAQKALAEKEALEQKYQDAIARADDFMGNKKYREAIGEYNLALESKPNESYPKNKITEAQAFIKEMENAQALKQEYDEAIAAGDGLFAAKDYQNALGQYQKAKDLLPEEALADTKIKETKAKLAEQVALAKNQENYQNTLAKADDLFLSKKFAESITVYNQALDILPDEQYPKDKIADAQSKLDAMAAEKEQINKAYDAAVAYGDELFGKDDYADAITAYQNALNYKTNETYPKEKIEEANKKIEEAKALAAKKAAEEVLAQSTKVAQEEKKETKVVSFTDITNFGDNEELREKAKEEARNEEPEENTQNSNKPKVPITTVPPEDLDAYRVLLGENYPEGVTKETINEGNKTFYRTVIVENKLGDEFLKVDARFGVFFFKNGLTIKASDYNAGINN